MNGPLWRGVARLTLLAAVLPACTTPFPGLDKRMRRFQESLGELPGSALEEFARTTAVASNTLMVLESVPLAGVHEMFGLAGELGSRELRRPPQVITGVAAFRKELERPLEIYKPERLVSTYLGTEGRRPHAVGENARFLLSMEFGRRLARDPRRNTEDPQPEQTDLLPRPLSFGEALFRSVPIW